MVLALGMPEHIPNTQGHDIAGTAECKYRSALGVDESRLEFWLPHLSGLYNNEVPSTIEGSCSRVNFPASQCGVGPGKRGYRKSGHSAPARRVMRSWCRDQLTRDYADLIKHRWASTHRRISIQSPRVLELPVLQPQASSFQKLSSSPSITSKYFLTGIVIMW